MLQPVQQIFAAGLDRLFEHQRVGCREIARAHRLDDVAGGKAQLLTLLVVDPLDLVDAALQMVGHEQIALADPVEHRIGAPGRILEPLVLRVHRIFRLDGILGRQETRPHLHAVGPEIAGALQRARIGETGDDGDRRRILDRLQACLEHHLLRPAHHPGPVLHILKARDRQRGG